MNLLLLVVAAVAAVSAPRAQSALPDDGRTRAAAEGALVVLGAAALLAALAGTLADAVDLADATVRMAAGAVLAAQGIAAMLLPLPPSEPRLGGRAAALVPVAFPTLLTPAVGLLAVSGSLDRSAPTTVGALLFALATVPLLALLVPRPSARAMRALGALLGAVLVVTGIGLVFDGIFDI
jgi:small neutral amino acid transporter SnatA (MarC family)